MKFFLLGLVMMVGIGECEIAASELPAFQLLEKQLTIPPLEAETRGSNIDSSNPAAIARKKNTVGQYSCQIFEVKQLESKNYIANNSALDNPLKLLAQSLYDFQKSDIDGVKKLYSNSSQNYLNDSFKSDLNKKLFEKKINTTVSISPVFAIKKEDKIFVFSKYVFKDNSIKTLPDVIVSENGQYRFYAGPITDPEIFRLLGFFSQNSDPTALLAK